MSCEIDRVKKHFSENKDVYIGIGVGILIGTTVSVLYLANNGSIKLAGNDNTFINNSDVVIKLTRRGHPGFHIRVNETGEEFASLKRTAEALGVSRNRLQDYFKGMVSDIDGLTFTKLGEM